jgi:hypothetical protein
MGRLALRQEWEALATPPLYGVDWFRVGKRLFICGLQELLCCLLF